MLVDYRLGPGGLYMGRLKYLGRHESVKWFSRGKLPGERRMPNRLPIGVKTKRDHPDARPHVLLDVCTETALYV